ncbi:MAG: NADPH-dependent oxidoreductase [Planctomycetaceae bacterium]|nr:NADPH-dependent oxidoreductase [Planctomycetaceae bacterium]
MPNPIQDCMMAHSSVRAFEPTPVPKEVIERCVAAAQMASTSSWIQAYSLLQIHDATKREALAELCGGQAQVHAAGAFFVVLADSRRHLLLAESAGCDHVQNLEGFLLVVVDASLFAQSLALAFESEGLGICFIGGLRYQLDEVDRLLDLPQGAWPLFGLSVGTPEEKPDGRPRLPLSAVLHHDRYPTDGEVAAATDAFDEVASAHYAERGLAGRTWSGGMARKFMAPVREELAAYYISKGARLS